MPRKPTDITVRNARAAKKRTDALALRVKKLEAAVKALQRR
jgi:hypothetical protein